MAFFKRRMSFKNYRVSPTLVSRVAALVILMSMVLSLVLPVSFANAQASTVASQSAGAAAICGFLGLGTSGAAGALTGGAAASAAGLVVPTHDALNFSANTTTSIETTGLVNKSCADAIATAVLKSAIGLIRDIIIRWIATGNFDGPVFSTSFSIDAAHIAENASRIFLYDITGINFCSFIGTPSIQSFFLNKDFGLTCSLPGNIDNNYSVYLVKKLYSPQQLAEEQTLEQEINSSNASNNKVYTLVEIARLRDQEIANALIAQAAEYTAGDGFYGVRDPKTGRVKTPGSAVAELVMQSQIVSPIRQTDVAKDIQTAIAAIVDTAVRVLVEKGLTAGFGQ